ncbi:c-type cytochrome [Aliiroseovarius sp.]|uniref:c-type cytochrome n=1 Tax=Aliiroseovarius sp. TaxID=1872442 RepID=UPI003BA9F2C2
MKIILSTAAAVLALSGAAFAEADIEKGEKVFKKCKACHAVIDPEGEVLMKGGKTGPNLYGIIGRQAGTAEDFGKYGDSLVAAGEGGLVWTEELLAAYTMDPKAFLAEQLGGSAKSNMTFKLRKDEEAANVAAFLASLAPAPEMTDGEGEGEAEGEADSDS